MAAAERMRAKQPRTTASAGRRSQAGPRSVTFDCPAPNATSVAVAGSFNDWRPRPMERGNDGIWRTVLGLDPGRHEYRFIVDGVWGEDPGNPDHVDNTYGGLNSVLNVR